MIQDFDKFVEFEFVRLFFKETEQIFDKLVFRQRNSHFFVNPLFWELVPIKDNFSLREFINKHLWFLLLLFVCTAHRYRPSLPSIATVNRKTDRQAPTKDTTEQNNDASDYNYKIDYEYPRPPLGKRKPQDPPLGKSQKQLIFLQSGKPPQIYSRMSNYDLE